MSENNTSEENKQIEQKQHSQNPPTDFWENCSQKTKTEIIDLLVSRLGIPKNELEKNCLDALSRKVAYFYGKKIDTRSQAVSSLIGQVIEITQKKFKDGYRMGQIYYSLKLTNKTTLRAIKEDLPAEKWTQIEKLAILDQELLFKYRKSIFGNDITDFYSPKNEPSSV